MLFDSRDQVTDLFSKKSLTRRVRTRDTLETAIYPPDGKAVGRNYYSGAETHDDFVYDGKMFDGGTQITFSTGVRITSTGRTTPIYNGGVYSVLKTTIGTLEARISNNIGSVRHIWSVPEETGDSPSYYVMTRDGASVRASVDGIAKTPTHGTNNLGTSDHSQMNENASVLDGDGYSGSGFWTHFYCWHRALTQDEMDKISRNPYQILKPAIPMMYYTGAGGGVAYSLPPFPRSKMFLKLIHH
jgi:hypothetical protein